MAKYIIDNAEKNNEIKKDTIILELSVSIICAEQGINVLYILIKNVTMKKK